MKASKAEGASGVMYCNKCGAPVIDLFPDDTKAQRFSTTVLPYWREQVVGDEDSPKEFVHAYLCDDCSLSFFKQVYDSLSEAEKTRWIRLFLSK